MSIEFHEDNINLRCALAAVLWYEEHKTELKDQSNETKMKYVRKAVDMIRTTRGVIGDQLSD